MTEQTPFIESCKSCRFYKPLPPVDPSVVTATPQTEGGYCRCFPPMLANNILGFTKHPRVRETEWCGEYRPSEARQAEMEQEEIDRVVAEKSEVKGDICNDT